MAEFGVVSRVIGNYVEVELTRSEACKHCNACVPSLTDKTMILRADNAGDRILFADRPFQPSSLERMARTRLRPTGRRRHLSSFTPLCPKAESKALLSGGGRDPALTFWIFVKPGTRP